MIPRLLATFGSALRRSRCFVRQRHRRERLDGVDGPTGSRACIGSPADPFRGSRSTRDDRGGHRCHDHHLRRAVIAPGRVLRISVKAEGDLTRADGGPPPARPFVENVRRIERSRRQRRARQERLHPGVPGQRRRTSGSVSVTWSIAFNGAPPRAGTHQMAHRWRIDSVAP